MDTYRHTELCKRHRWEDWMILSQELHRLRLHDVANRT